MSFPNFLHFHWSELFYYLAIASAVYAVCVGAPSMMLAGLIFRQPKAAAIVIAVSLACLLIASPLALHSMEWGTLGLTLMASVIGLLNGAALLSVWNGRSPRWLFAIVAPFSIAASCTLVTRNMYPEPTIYFLAYVFAGVPLGIIAATGISMVLHDAWGKTLR